mmetsp:Transcript_18061/g.21626  ORF Transcript_18061/g.21626 Transcript_18061/m.21626 type:complete len:222 (-) Transcript_18061:762-1427(-)
MSQLRNPTLGRTLYSVLSKTLCPARHDVTAMFVSPMLNGTTTREYARKGFARKRPGKTSSAGSEDVAAAPPAPAAAPPAPAAAPAPAADPWQPVTDPASGQVYWWNKQTNETTHIGAPKPVAGAPAAEPAAPMGGGLMGMVAEGMAFGTGSAIARTAVGSMFGGGGGGHPPSGEGEAPPSEPPPQQEAPQQSPWANDLNEEEEMQDGGGWFGGMFDDDDFE